MFNEFMHGNISENRKWNHFTIVFVPLCTTTRACWKSTWNSDSYSNFSSSAAFVHTAESWRRWRDEISFSSIENSMMKCENRVISFSVKIEKFKVLIFNLTLRGSFTFSPRFKFIYENMRNHLERWKTIKIICCVQLVTEILWDKFQNLAVLI